MTFLKIVQGVNTPIRAYHQPAVMIIKGQNGVVQFTGETDSQTGEIWINVNIDQNNYIDAGLAQFQIFQNGELKEYGNVEIVPSLLVNPQQDLRGKYKQIVDAIEATLAGVATKGQKRVQVGDKNIDKYSAYQLLKLLDYFKGKLAEEESGSDINTKTDEMNIKYVWRIR